MFKYAQLIFAPMQNAGGLEEQNFAIDEPSSVMDNSIISSFFFPQQSYKPLLLLQQSHQQHIQTGLTGVSSNVHTLEPLSQASNNILYFVQRTLDVKSAKTVMSCETGLSKQNRIKSTFISSFNNKPHPSDAFYSARPLPRSV